MSSSGATIEVENVPGSPPNDVGIDIDGNPILAPPIENESIEEKSPLDQEKPPEIDAGMAKVGRFATIMNLANALIGAGIISVPGSFVYTGVGPTTLLLLISCSLCMCSSVIILNNQKELGFTGLDEMAMMVFGKWAEVLSSVLIMLFSFSCTSAYLIIGATQIRAWLSLTSLDVSSDGAWYLIVVCYWLVLDMPISLLKSVKFLSRFSIVSIFCIGYYAIIITIKAIIKLAEGSAPSETAIGYQFGFGLFTAFGIHALTFCLPVVFMPIIAPYNPSIKKRSIVLGITYIVCFILIFTPGCLGYLIFGKNTPGDILQSFPANDIPINIAKICIFFNVTVSFPVIAVSIVGSIGQLAFKQNIPELMPTKKRVIITLIVDAANLLVAMFLQDIRPVLGIGGSLGGCMVSFVLPSACHLKMTKEKWTTWGNILHLAFVVFGLICTVLCTISSVMDAIDKLS